MLFLVTVGDSVRRRFLETNAHLFLLRILLDILLSEYQDVKVVIDAIVTEMNCYVNIILKFFFFN